MGEIHRPVEQNKEAGDRPTYLSVCQDRRVLVSWRPKEKPELFLTLCTEMDSWWNKDLRMIQF